MKKLIILLIIFSFGVHAKQYLPDTVLQDEVIFERCNDYTLRYGLVIKVAEIGWYAPDCQNKSLLETSDKILRFHYFKNVEAEFFKESAEEYFILNLEKNSIQPGLSEALKVFNNGYCDIQPGQYFQLHHSNDNTLSLFRNEELLATTENAFLARNYFNIWFGKKPVIEKLRNAFL